MLCPACQTELKMSDRQGVEIDYCPKCRGVWLDRGELDKIIERSIQSESAPPPSSVLGTPSSAYTAKRKNDEFYDDDDTGEFRRVGGGYDRDDRDDRYDPRRKKKSFLGEIFDIFD